MLRIVNSVRTGPARNRARAVVSAWIAVLLFVLYGCQPDPMSQEIERLRTGSPEERARAAQTLSQSRGMRIAPEMFERIEEALKTALNDNDPQVRRIAADGLRGWGRPDLTAASVAAMKSDLSNESVDVRRKATDVLINIPSTESTEALTVALRNSDPTVRNVAALALQRRNVELSTEDQVHLHLVLDQPEPVMALGRTVLPTLVDLLDEDATMRNASAHAIALIRDREASEKAATLILEDLESPDARSRALAVSALGALGDNRALTPLQNLAEHDPDADVQARAKVAVYVLQNDTVSLIRTLEDPDTALEMIAIRGLRHMPDKEKAIEPLLRMLRTTTHQVIANAVITTLGTCGPTATGTILEQLSEEPEWSIRLRLARALNQEPVLRGMNEEREVVLYQLYEEEVNDSVRDEIARTLERLQSS